MYCLTSYASPIGLLTLGSDGKHLTGLWIQGQKYFGGENVGEIGKEQGPEPTVFGDVRKWLDRYFSGQKPCPDELPSGARGSSSGQKPCPDELPLAPEGTEFQKLIWGLLCEIPYGTVTTYGDLAKKAAARMGRDTMSGQAVGGALAHNPVSIIIPCHRVVGSGGSLTGYAGGLDRKIWLLDHEGVDVSRFSVPVKGTAL